jgi:hypothetical protein
MNSTSRLVTLETALVLALLCTSCKDGSSPPPPGGTAITTDAQLFSHITTTDPFTGYALFPNADSITSGTLNGSHAHRPLVRVSMNATAFGALRGDTLPAGSSFPTGAIIFKQIISDGEVTLYAILYKDPGNSSAGNGWLWAEYYPSGSIAFSITNRGAGCTTCHALEQGPQHDYIRTFERQHR